MTTATIPDRICQHKDRLRTCAMPACVELRTSMFKNATKAHRLDSEPWPNSFGETHIAIDLTESKRDYRMPTPYEALAPARGIAWAIVLGVAMVLVISGLYLWWKAGL